MIDGELGQGLNQDEVLGGEILLVPGLIRVGLEFEHFLRRGATDFC